MKMMDIPAGRYKAKAIPGSARYYAKPGKQPQIWVNLDVPAVRRTVTAFLSFAPTAAPYSVRKLQALGWRGTKVEDLSDLTGLDKNEVDIEVRHETYMNEPRLKVEISLPGVVSVSDNNVARNEFMARIAAMHGSLGLPPSKKDDDDDVPF